MLKRFVAAEPKHGEKWQATAKAVENSHEPTESILKKVVATLKKEENLAENNHNQSDVVSMYLIISTDFIGKETVVKTSFV